MTRHTRGFSEDHKAAKWLRYQSFVSGREITDAVVTDSKLPAILAKEFAGLLPIVRWLNAALVGPVALTALFQGSTNLTEQLSARKYPAYTDYQKRTSRLIPWWPASA